MAGTCTRPSVIYGDHIIWLVFTALFTKYSGFVMTWTWDTLVGLTHLLLFKDLSTCIGV